MRISLLFFHRSLNVCGNRVVGTELYTHEGDDGMVPAAFDDFENTNLAGHPDYENVQKQLTAQLRELAEQWMTPMVPSA